MFSELTEGPSVVTESTDATTSASQAIEPEERVWRCP